MITVIVKLPSSIAEYLGKNILEYYKSKPWLPPEVIQQARVCSYRMIMLSRKIDRGEELILPLYLQPEDFIFIHEYIKIQVKEFPDDILYYAALILFNEPDV